MKEMMVLSDSILDMPQ